MSEPGIYRDISEADYHASEGVSKSKLWVLHSKSPAHMQYGEKFESAAMSLGTLIHAAVLTPDALSQYVVAPAMNKNTNVYKDWKAEQLVAGKIICDHDDFDAATRIAKTLNNDRMLYPILNHAEFMAEASGYWVDEMTGLLCRCRWDGAVPSRTLLDLKSTADASSTDVLIRSIIKFGYHVQAASYRHAWKELTGEALPFLFAFVEVSRPHAYRLVELDKDFLDLGWDIYRRALDTYHQCVEQGEWPAYPTMIDTLDAPEWYRRSLANPYMEIDF